MILPTPVAALFVRSDSHYKSFDGVECYDIDRDARTYDGPHAVVAHPPCRGWGRLRTFANVRPDERNLARLGVSLVRTFGGVLEHPYGSTLWSDQRLPMPGQGYDQFGGWSLRVQQCDWGHKAEKDTILYIVGVLPEDMPTMPPPGRATHVVNTPFRVGDPRRMPEITKREREETPPSFGAWLVEVARTVGWR